MAQRIVPEGLIVSCDFCGVDWDGVSPAIEGHRGAIICLDCLKTGLEALQRAGETFKCILCLRDNLPPTMERWSHTEHPAVFACGGCVRQAAKAFSDDPDVPFTLPDRK